MYNTLPNKQTLLKFLGLKRSIYFFTLILVVLLLFLRVATDVLTSGITEITFLLFGWAFILSFYLREWFRVRKLESDLVTTIDTATGFIVQLTKSLEHSEIEKSALLKLLKGLDHHVLQKAGIRLFIQDKQEKRLPN